MFLAALLFATGACAGRHAAWAHAQPVRRKAAAVAKQRPPGRVAHAHLDPEALQPVVVPLADIGDPREEWGEAEAQQPLVEALLPAKSE